jgi:hypothetical protein
MKKLAALALAVPVGVLLAVAIASASPSDRLQAVKAATAHYHSFAQAQAAGYTIAGEPCVEAPGLGAMGIHAVNPALAMNPSIDPMRPEILLATDTDRPTLFGQPFDGPMPGHNPTMPIHYDLHVWLWADNPAGLFAQFNPNLSCPT